MKMSRRTFLEGSAGALATIALAAGTGLTIKAFEASATSSDEVQWKSAFCCFCHNPTCATKVKIVNGVAVEIMGDENSESNEGRLCLRGMSALNQLYNPYRVKAPMKRTNPVKGLNEDPGWVEISWEEALDTVAGKLKEAIDINPLSIIVTTGFGVEESFDLTLLQTAFGGTNDWKTPGCLCPEHFNQLHLNGQMLDRIDLEYVDYVVEIGRTMGSDWCATAAGHTKHYADALERGTKFVTVNPYCTHSAQRGEWVPIMPGTDTALGLGLLNTIIHEIGVYDEHFLKVRTNSPYLIEPKFTMIKGRKVYKESYVRNSEGKPLVWDEVLNKAVPFDTSKGESYALLGTYEVGGKTAATAFQILKDFVKEFTPEWAEPITTIPAAKIREIAKDLISHARIGSTIDIEGFEFPYRPAGIFMGRGMASHMLGVEAAKALGTVNVLLGNLDVPGGIQGTSNANWYTLNPDKDGILTARGIMQNQVVGKDVIYPPKSIDMGDYYPMTHSPDPLSWNVILEPEKYHIEYPVKLMFLHGGDPIGSSVNCQEAEEAMKKIPFVASIAYHYDLPTQFCDILLASSSLLEKDAMYRMFRNEKECTNHTRGLMGTLVRRPVVDNVYNTKVPEDIMIELAERVGRLTELNMVCNNNKRGLFNQVSPAMAVGLKPEYELKANKKYTWREYIERKISSDFGPEAIAEFDKCAFRPFRLSLKESYNYFYVPEDAVRLPIYYERMIQNGEKMMQQLKSFNVTVPNQDMDHIYSHYSGLAVWYENAGFETTEEYPFKVVNWKIHYGVNNTGGLYENAYVQEVIDQFNPYLKCIWLPASVAAKLEIKEGDTVCLESRYGGKTQGKVHLSQFMHPKCIGIPGNFGRRTSYMSPLKEVGVHFNSLLTAKESTLNPISVSLESSPQIKIYKI